MIINLKEGSRCAVNHNEDLTAIDFNGDASLAEKEAVVLSTVVKILMTIDFDGDVEIAAVVGFTANEHAIECAEGWSSEDSVKSAREGVVGRRADPATVSIGCYVFDHSVRLSLMQSHNRWKSLSVDAEEAVVGRGRWRKGRGLDGIVERGSSCCCNNKGYSEGSEQRSTRGGRGALCREGCNDGRGRGGRDSGDNYKEGKLLAVDGGLKEKAAAKRPKDKAMGAAPFSYRKKIMVGASAVDSDAEWRRLRWQRRTQGRKRLLRLGWPTTGAGATATTGNRLAVAEAAMWEATVTETTTRWVRLEAMHGGGGYGDRGGYGYLCYGFRSDGGAAGEGPDDARRSVSISLVPLAEEVEDRCDWGSGCRHPVAAVGFGEEEEHSLGRWHSNVGSAVEEVERAPRREMVNAIGEHGHPWVVRPQRATIDREKNQHLTLDSVVDFSLISDCRLTARKVNIS
ncbi:hypothetical protein B296_00023822 [Ensete ventricosum]|uniref:Uncharacterized protein n=1 Tax=Ensete ventricosum TaxID=4639 RepID=A0A426Z280_ENSVE|nr:hypothetical protein B296_00023822 [Ensete ventricosum]